MEVLNNIGFDWQVAVANFVSFLIIYLILHFKVFGPVGKILNERRSRIEEGLAQAQAGKEAFEKNKEDAEVLLMDARREANEIISKAQHRADEVVASSAAKAEEAANRIMSEAQVSIDHERTSAERDLLGKVSHLVALGVSRVLGKEINQSIDEQLSQRALDELRELNQ